MDSGALFFGIVGGSADGEQHGAAPVRPLLEAVPGGVLYVDAQRRIVAVNNEVCRLVGLREDQLIGRDAASFASVSLTEDSEAPPAFPLTKALETGASQGPHTFGVRRPDGSCAWFVIRVVPARDATGAVLGAVITYLDITERKRAEDELRQSEAKWRLLAENLPDYVLMLDREGRVTSTNRVAEHYTGVSIVGRYAYEFAHPDHVGAWQASFAQAIGTLKPIRFEIRAGGLATDVWYEQTLMPIVEDGRVERVLSTVRDVTERRAMMARLAVKERVTSVGMLSASVAHEILNPLTSVLANLDFALSERCPEGERKTKALREAREGAARMQQIVRDLRALGRANAAELFYVDVRSVLEMALRLAGPEVAPNVEVQLDTAEIPGVIASESRLCQVFINLVVNAVQSMSDRPPEDRKLRIRTRYDDATTFVAVDIVDNGVGIKREVLNRIFDPFFTTKESGTGLGLSISRESVEQMGGRIDVTSEIGRGSTFTVWLATMRGAPLPGGAPESRFAAASVPVIER